MSALDTICPATTATPSSSSAPVAGTVSILTEAKSLAGLTVSTSANPKFAALITKGVSSLVVSVLSAPVGSLFLPKMVKVSVDVAVPPWPSLTW